MGLIVGLLGAFLLGILVVLAAQLGPALLRGALGVLAVLGGIYLVLLAGSAIGL